MAPSPDNPSGGAAAVAVVPFEDLSDEGGQPWFARGFVDDIVADLSRFANLDVVSTLDPTTSDVEGRIDYVLTGTLRRGGRALRVTVQLVAAEDRRVIWAGRYDREDAELFEVQDDITARVVGAVSSGIDASLLAAARRKPITALEVYDTWLRGMDVLRRGTLEADREARRLFERAVGVDPHFSRAHLGLSLTYFNEWSCQLWHAWDENEKRAFEHAERANRLDEDDHLSHLVLGRVLLFRREFGPAEAHLDRALALNSNDADALVQLAMSFALLGRTQEARTLYRRAHRLSPNPPLYYHAFGGIVAFAATAYDDVLHEFGRAPAGAMVDMPAHCAVARVELGDPTGARSEVEAFLRNFSEKITPGRPPERGEALRWLAHVNPYRDPANVARLVEGVRRAGLDVGARSAPIEVTPTYSAFRKVGSLWELSYQGENAHLPNAKGLADLARLLARPDQEIHCTELMGVESSPAAAPEAVDRQARDEYRRRIADLQAVIDECETAGDAGRALAAREELEALRDHITAAFGLGGRARRPGAPEEKARSAVTQRIRASIRRIEENLPALGRHLAVSVRTGAFCSYAPETTPDWHL